MKKILIAVFAIILLFSTCMFDVAQETYTSVSINLTGDTSVDENATTKLANMGWLNYIPKEKILKEA